MATIENVSVKITVDNSDPYAPMLEITTGRKVTLALGKCHVLSDVE